MALVDHLVNVAMLGATWVLWVLVALSLASVAAMVERWLFYRRSRRDGASLDAALEVAVAQDDDEAIREALERSRAVEAVVLRSAWAFRDGGPAAFADAVDGAVAGVRHKLDRGTTLLGTIGNNAPFVGLLGTVIGVVGAFQELGKPQALSSTVAEAGSLAPERVMGTIAEALVATAVGLVVAIPAVALFNYFQGRVAAALADAETLGHVLLAHLRGQEPAHRERVSQTEAAAAAE
jgi:biopolymer transport protein ExbB